MRLGKMFNPGEVILTEIQFTDTFEIKKRPALILFEEHNNIVVAGITSNLEMNGIELTTKEGAIKNSIIKLNYIFTISKNMVTKKLFNLTKEKKKEVFNKLTSYLNQLNK
jgi:mRNA interferase MazF